LNNMLHLHKTNTSFTTAKRDCRRDTYEKCTVGEWSGPNLKNQSKTTRAVELSGGHGGLEDMLIPTSGNGSVVKEGVRAEDVL